PHGGIAGCLVGHVYIMALVGKTDKRPAHRDHIIVGMWRENDGPLFSRVAPFGALAIVGIGLATRPTGNGMLQLIEYVNVDVVYRSFFGGKLRHAVVVVIVFRKFQYRLIERLR